MTRRIAGFTLIELMIAIVVIGIAMTLAVPSFNGMVQRNRMATQVNDFLLAINLARSEAMRRGSPVTIQSMDNGAENDNEFGNGYCVQVGVQGTGFSTSCTYNASKCAPSQTTGCILRRFEELTGTASLDSVEGASAISFGPLGELLLPAAIQNLDMCDSRNLTDGRRIRIALVGRSKSHRSDDPDSAKQPSC
ncbi:MAG: prepilin-type N-terminal cleavage/methylation domain-containing protein [Gammaproteobacteria bacterium]|jgi:type IV fimbrial biogenesis protein FimT|nr:prepilin-type N-terminal cleavage/methylation domain-containing protein [Gammaproteobacteria bacterium]